MTVELAGDHFFAGAVFAGDEHGGSGWGDALDELAQAGHRGAATEEIAVTAVLLAEVAVDLDELAVGVGFFEDDLNLPGREWLDEVIESACAHAGDGAFDGAVAGHHDDERSVGQGADAFEKLLAVAVGQAHVEHDEVECFLREHGFGLRDRARDGDGEFFALKELVEDFLDQGFVVENEDSFE